MFYEPMTRSETVKFRVKLDREGVERRADAHSPRLRYLVEQCSEGDTGYADYTVNIQYFGDVVKKLECSLPSWTTTGS